MNQEFKIMGVGSPIVDAIAQVDDAFLDQIEGEKGGMVLVDAHTLSTLKKRLPSPPVMSPGGSAGNTLFALARLGATTRFLGKTGNCPQGEFYRNSFQKLGGDSSRFKIGAIPNGQCLSLVTPDGERTMRTDLGSAMTLTPDEISVDDFSGCQHVHIEGYLLFNEALMRAVLTAAKTAGCSISLDLASFEVVNATKPILESMLSEYVDLVFANEEEANALTGLGDDYTAMARELAKFCEVAVVKVGAKGSYFAAGGKIQHVAAESVDTVLDTTGAGDLWAAGFLFGWARELPFEECARIGSILGAAVVQHEGCALPDQVWESIIKKINQPA